MRQDANNNPERLLKELSNIKSYLEALEPTINPNTDQPKNPYLLHKLTLCLLSVCINPSLKIFTITSFVLLIEFKHHQHLINENKLTPKILSMQLNKYTDQIQQMIDEIDIDSSRIFIPYKYIKKRDKSNELTTSYITRIGKLKNIINAASEHIKKMPPVEPLRTEKVKACCSSLRTCLAR